MSSSAYMTVTDRVAEILRDNHFSNAYQSMSSAHLIEKIRTEINDGTLDLKIVDGTIYQYITYAANNDESAPFVSGGPRRGYIYEALDPVLLDPDQPKVEFNLGDSEEIAFRESDLYPLIEVWLTGKGFLAKDVADLKGGGKWGNPDILGITRTELFGCVEIEIASCEVKLASANWQQFIFEAVSHKRFVNRSWYCFRSEKDEALPKELTEYAERYRVGIVQIVLSNTQLSELKKAKNLTDRLKFIDYVDEKIPATYEHVSLTKKAEIAERAGFVVGLNSIEN